MMMGGYHIHYARFIATVIIISIGPFICGISLGFSSSVSAQLLIGDNLIAFFSSLINLGALVGSLIVGPVLNTLGRRAALRISAVPSIIGWLLIAAAQGLSPPSTEVEPLLVSSLLLGRILSGLAAGMMTAVGSVYLVEVAPPHQSGRIGSLAQFATVAGTCFAYYCGMVTTWYETAEFMAIISVVLLVVTFYLPESPAWLAKHNQMQAALGNLIWLRLDQKVAAQELSDLSPGSSVEAEKPLFLPHSQHAFRDSAGDRSSTSWLVRLLLPCVTIPPELSGNLRIALLLMVAQQTTGINVITFYTEPLCQRMVHVTHSARCAFTLGLAQLFFSLFASFLIINRLPRRLLVVATGVVMSISMFFFAVGQQLSPVVPSLALVGFLLGFQCGWGPLAMLVSTELFPPQHRGTVGGAAVAVNWITSFVVTQTFQPFVNALGGGTFSDAGGNNVGIGEVVIFLFYSTITIFATVWLHRRLPETNKAFLPSAASASVP
ncbi:Facilitated trehalose transporter Tret1 [Taenia solium]|eukprot:TsM_000025800 transcript=TsM_000025800 gene=TsM_000025800